MDMQAHSQNIHTTQRNQISHIDTHRHADIKIHTHSQPHAVQWLYFKFVKEVELNESYPAVRFPGTGLTSSTASLPSAPSGPLESPPHLVPMAETLSSCAKWPSHSQPVSGRLSLCLTLRDHTVTTPDPRTKPTIWCYLWSLLICQLYLLPMDDVRSGMGAKYILFSCTLFSRLAALQHNSVSLWLHNIKKQLEASRDDWFRSHCY